MSTGLQAGLNRCFLATARGGGGSERTKETRLLRCGGGAEHRHYPMNAKTPIKPPTLCTRTFLSLSPNLRHEHPIFMWMGRMPQIFRAWPMRVARFDGGKNIRVDIYPDFILVFLSQSGLKLLVSSVPLSWVLSDAALAMAVGFVFYPPPPRRFSHCIGSSSRCAFAIVVCHLLQLGCLMRK